jgi:hypothetical protein
LSPGCWDGGARGPVLARKVLDRLRGKKLTAGCLTMIWGNDDQTCDALELNMRPLLHPMLINGQTGDPALYIETLFERARLQACGHREQIGRFFDPDQLFYDELKRA